MGTDEIKRMKERIKVLDTLIKEIKEHEKKGEILGWVKKDESIENEKTEELPRKESKIMKTFKEHDIFDDIKEEEVKEKEAVYFPFIKSEQIETEIKEYKNHLPNREQKQIKSMDEVIKTSVDLTIEYMEEKGMLKEDWKKKI